MVSDFGKSGNVFSTEAEAVGLAAKNKAAKEAGATGLQNGDAAKQQATDSPG